MKATQMMKAIRRAMLAASLAWLAGCAGQQAFQEGNGALARGDVAGGLAKLREAVRLDPQNGEYRKTLAVKRDAAQSEARRELTAALESGDFQAARTISSRINSLDGGDGKLAPVLAELIEHREAAWRRLSEAEGLAAKGQLQEAGRIADEVTSDIGPSVKATALARKLARLQSAEKGREFGIYPALGPAYKKPVSLKFTDASVRQVLDALRDASGLNYIFDKEVQPSGRVTLAVKDKPLEDVLSIVLTSNQLAFRVLDADTLLIYPATAGKQAEYKEVAIRVFYVSNADATKVAALVKQVTKAREIQVDERMGLIVMRESPEVIRVAEKLIASADIAEPEVMLEVEVMEVNKSRLMEAGIQWPEGLSVGIQGSSGVPGDLTYNDLANRSRQMLRFNLGDPLVTAKLRSAIASANLLANPRIRVKNRTAAKVLIGDKVPVVTIVGNSLGGTSESVSYLDVGLKLEIEPSVAIDDDVSMKVNLEVSNIVETVVRNSGTQTYRIGTRNTTTSLRVKDGETSVLAGLIRNEERRSNTGVPYMNEAPMVGKLFGAGSDSDAKTEIVLLVTPRVIRNVEMPGLGLHEFSSGTEGAVGSRPLSLRQVVDSATMEKSASKTGQVTVSVGAESPGPNGRDGSVAAKQDGTPQGESEPRSSTPPPIIREAPVGAPPNYPGQGKPAKEK